MTLRNKLFPIFPIKFVLLTFIQIIGLKKEMFMARKVFFFYFLEVAFARQWNLVCMCY